jgi:hypothetical protein
MFLVLLPIAFLGQFVRSRRLPPHQRHFAADLIEAAGLALAISLSVQGGTLFSQWPTWISFAVLFAIIYFPVCFFADWFRKRARHDA